MAAPGLTFALFWWWTSRHQPKQLDTPPMRNPLSLSVALQFAILYAIIVFFGRWSQEQFGGAGLYVVSFLSGLTDMDAIALSMSQMTSSQHISPSLAARCILIGASSNTLIKLALAISLGSPELRPRLFLALGTTFLAGLAGAWIVGL